MGSVSLKERGARRKPRQVPIAQYRTACKCRSTSNQARSTARVSALLNEPDVSPVLNRDCVNMIAAMAVDEAKEG